VRSATDERPLLNFVHLFALFGFAVGAPMFELLRRNPEFLISHGLGSADTAVLALALLLPLPAATWLVERIGRLLGRRVGRCIHLVFVALLVAVGCLPPIVRALPQASAWTIAPVVAAGGCAAAFAYARWEPARRFATLLAFGPVVFATLFWLDDSIAKVRRGGGAVAPGARVTATAPVVWIVFDELPLTSLLNAEWEIDAGRYPSFAALAREATWFRDTITVAEETAMAVPSIVTGRYPDASLLPIAADHPGNLFSLLDTAYDLHVFEPRTLLDPRRGDRRRTAGDASREGSGGLYADLTILFAHVVAPSNLAVRLPTIAEDWKGFAAPHPDELARIQKRDYADRLADFERFSRSIAPCANPCLYFAHFVLPHVPWYYMPSGRIYTPADVYGIRRPEGRWGADDWWVLQGYQRHLFQVALVDQLLGRLIAKLRRADLYDRALVVVTADHGASFRPGASRRLLAGHSHPADILRVPLFVKAPHQRRGEVRDVPIATIDILPTAADLLGIRVGWETDGISAVDPAFVGRERRAGFGMDGRRFEYEGAATRIDDGLEKKLAAFGSGDGVEGLFAFGAHRALVGRRAADLERAPTAGLEATIASEPFAIAAGDRGAEDVLSPARITGRLELPSAISGERYVAIAAGGTIRAVAPTYRMGLITRAFSIFLPEEAFDRSRAEFEVFLVTGPPERPVLRSADAEFAPILAELRKHLERDPDTLRR
jgi:hypothetical protein